MNEYSLTQSLQNNVDKTAGKLSTVPEIVEAMQESARLKLKNISLDAVGKALILHNANVRKTALEFCLTVQELRILIQTEPLLNAYWREAFRSVKALVDDKVIELLENGDERMIGVVYKNMYSGRARGGYNPNELGTLGYDDAVAEDQKKAVEEDTKNSRNIIIQFEDKRTELADHQTIEGLVLEETDALLADFEEAD